MKKIIYYSISLFILLTGCNPSNNSSRILLETSGYADSTKIYLVNMETTITIDSGYIVNNQLSFYVDVTEPTQFMIHPVIKPRADIDTRIFWKDNRQVILRAEKGNLKNAVVEGPEIQIQADIVKAVKDRLIQLNDSLYSAYRAMEDKQSEVALALRAKGKEVTKAITDADVNYITDNPDELFSVITLKRLMAYTIPKDKTRELYESLSVEMQSTKYGMAVKKFLDLSLDLKVGDRAVDFQLPDLDGNMVGLNDFQGKYILLDFWGSGCGPCRMENPNLLRNYKAYRDRGFEIISISFDKDREAWAKAVEKDSMIWTTVCDLKGGDGDVIMTYNVYFMPTYFLINPEGIIIDKFLGAGQLDSRLKEIFAAE